MLDINFNQIIEMIKKRKNNAYRKVNEEMILLYLEVGKDFVVLKIKMLLNIELVKICLKL